MISPNILRLLSYTDSFKSNTDTSFDDDDDGVYLDKLHTRGVKRSILYM